MNAPIFAARNPFRYEAPQPTTQAIIEEPCCVGEGSCGDAVLRIIRTSDGELRVIKEKVPSTLGKAEGLGG